MRIFLKTPYTEKDEAKSLGARWDPVKKSWYIDDPSDLNPFKKWIEKRDIEESNKKFNENKTNNVQKEKKLDSCECNVLPWEDCTHTKMRS